MGNKLAYEVFEEMKEDIKNDNFGARQKYLDTWDYEDEFSHNDIEDARIKFVELANEYFETTNMLYEAREVCDNVYIFDIE